MQNYDYIYAGKLPYISHPMREHIPFWVCEKEGCSEVDISISDAGYSVHPHSGDAYGSYTLRCTRCGKVERNSFSDN